MKILNKLILFSLLASLAGCGASSFDEGQFLLENKGDSVVKVVSISNPGHGGTGFSVKAPSGHNYIVTNAHVCGVAENNKVRIVYHNGDWVDLDVIKVSDDTDLCIIEEAVMAPPLEVAREVRRFARVNVLGHPLLRELSYKAGYLVKRGMFNVFISSAESCDLTKSKYIITEEQTIFGTIKYCAERIDSWDTNIETWGGNSGSPALNDDGDIVGVVYAGSNETHYGVIVPLEVLKNFLYIF